MNTTHSFCQPLLFLNFLSRYPDNWFSRPLWWSTMATLVARCQHTWTELLDLWPLGLVSRVLLPSLISEWGNTWSSETGNRIIIPERSRPSSDPLIDFKLKYLLVGESIPRSLANWKNELWSRVIKTIDFGKYLYGKIIPWCVCLPHHHFSCWLSQQQKFAQQNILGQIFSQNKFKYFQSNTLR